MKRAILPLAGILIFSFTGVVAAQVRPVERQEPQTEEPAQTQEVSGEIPEVIKTEYKGGVYGYSEKEKGTIRFDDINERLIFFGEDGKEKFSIPYDAIAVVYPSQKKVQSGTGRTVSMIPLPGAAIGGLFMKKKKNYLVIQYSDPDVAVQGTANFLMDTGDELFAAIRAVGEKAELQKRGDAYIRKRTE